MSRSDARGRVGAFVAATLLLAGCGVASLHERAAADFGCAQDAIQTEHLSGVVDKAQGCGKSDVYGWHWEQNRWFSVLERASFELSCPRQDLSVTVLGPRQVGVSGCDAKRVYVFTDAGWLLDSGAGGRPAGRSAGPRPGEAGVLPHPATANLSGCFPGDRVHPVRKVVIRNPLHKPSRPRPRRHHPRRCRSRTDPLHKRSVRTDRNGDRAPPPARRSSAHTPSSRRARG